LCLPALNLACHACVGSPCFVLLACLCLRHMVCLLVIFYGRVELCLLGMNVFSRHVLRFDSS
jgi:hypothetical protein